VAVTPIAVSPSLATVLNAAGDRNDVDFDYLLKTAERESSLNPQAKAATSSATGLFQFLDTTWLRVMKSEGPRLGYQKYADAITANASGDYVIKDPKIRAAVLKLREDPQVAADMAAAFTKSNGDYLKSRFGRMPSPGELYIAHFLGAQGAEKMFNAGLQNPDQVAAKLFPREAAANRTIFYDHGKARTIREVYKALVAQHEGPATLHPGYAVQQLAAQQNAAEVAAVQQAAGHPVPLAPVLGSQSAAAVQPVPLAPLPQQATADAAAPAPLELMPDQGQIAASQQPAANQPVPLAPTRRPQAVATATPGQTTAGREQTSITGARRQGYYVVEQPVASTAPADLGNSRPITANANTAPEIPSRIGPANMSFASLFSTEPDGTAGSPVAAPMEDGGAFFSQLYGQQ